MNQRFINATSAGALVLMCACSHTTHTVQDNAASAVASTHTMLTLSGTLLLNGSEPSAWLGVVTSDGNMTRLYFEDRALLNRYRQWQNKRVVIQGHAMQPSLATPQVKVLVLELAQ